MTDYKKLNIDGTVVADFVTNNSPMDCVVINGEIYFGKMVIPTIESVAPGKNYVQFQLKNNNNWDTGVCRVYYDINNIEPDLLFADSLASKELSDTINVDGLTPDTEYTLYARTYYNGVFSGLNSLIFSTTGTLAEIEALFSSHFTLSITANKTATLVSTFSNTLNLDLSVTKAQMLQAMFENSVDLTIDAKKYAYLQTIFENSLSLDMSAKKYAYLQVLFDSSLNLNIEAKKYAYLQAMFENTISLDMSAKKYAYLTAIFNNTLDLTIEANKWAQLEAMFNSGVELSLMAYKQAQVDLASFNNSFNLSVSANKYAYLEALLNNTLDFDLDAYKRALLEAIFDNNVEFDLEAYKQAQINLSEFDNTVNLDISAKKYAYLDAIFENSLNLIMSVYKQAQVDTATFSNIFGLNLEAAKRDNFEFIFSSLLNLTIEAYKQAHIDMLSFNNTLDLTLEANKYAYLESLFTNTISLGLEAYKQANIGIATFSNALNIMLDAYKRASISSVDFVNSLDLTLEANKYAYLQVLLTSSLNLTIDSYKQAQVGYVEFSSSIGLLLDAYKQAQLALVSLNNTVSLNLEANKYALVDANFQSALELIIQAYKRANINTALFEDVLELSIDAYKQSMIDLANFNNTLGFLMEAYKQAQIDLVEMENSLGLDLVAYRQAQVNLVELDNMLELSMIAYKQAQISLVELSNVVSFDVDSYKRANINLSIFTSGLALDLEAYKQAQIEAASFDSGVNLDLTAYKQAQIELASLSNSLNLAIATYKQAQVNNASFNSTFSVALTAYKQAQIELASLSNSLNMALSSYKQAQISLASFDSDVNLDLTAYKQAQIELASLSSSLNMALSSYKQAQISLASLSNSLNMSLSSYKRANIENASFTGTLNMALSAYKQAQIDLAAFTNVINLAITAYKQAQVGTITLSNSLNLALAAYKQAQVSIASVSSSINLALTATKRADISLVSFASSISLAMGADHYALYTIAYVLNGGTNNASNPSSYLALDLPITLYAATKTGYTFNGWYYDAAFSAGPITSIPVGATGDKTLYAKLTLNTYTLTADKNGGTGGNASATYNITTSFTIATLLGSPTKTGYTLSGWKCTVASGNWTLNTIYATSQNVLGKYGNATLQAQWAAESYTYRFDSNGGSSVDDISEPYGASLSGYDVTTTKLGYTFDGWYYDESTWYSQWTKPATMPDLGTSGDIVYLYAKWTPNSFSITLHPNQGSWSTYNSISVVYNTYIDDFSADMVDGSRLGYTFKGYYTAASGGIQRISPTGYVALTSTTYTTAATLYAQWDPNEYTVTFEENGGSTVSDITQDFGTSVVQPANPTKTGYTFGGWYTDSDLTTLQTWPFNMPFGGKTLYAKWTANTYTVTFDSQGGSTPSPTSKNVTFGSDYGTLPTVTKTGYIFAGWFTEPSGGTDVYFFTDVFIASNHTLYAQWTAKNITLYLDATTNGGTQAPDDEISVVYNTSIETFRVAFHIPASPVGYYFMGYYTAASGGTQMISPLGYTAALTTTTYSSDTTLYAQFSPTTYTLTADKNGGTGGNASATYNITTSSTLATLLGSPAKTGYTLAGWKCTVADGNWVLNTVYGTSLNVSGKYGNATLQAQWSINSYTVTFEENGGSTVSDITQNYNTSVAQPANPTKTGYTFGGWYTDSGLTTLQTWPFNMPVGGKTLYAKWTPNSFNIILNGTTNGGTNASNNLISVTYNTSIEAFNTDMLPTPPSGYVFNGYYTSSTLGFGTKLIDSSGYIALTSTTYTSTTTLYAQYSVAPATTTPQFVSPPSYNPPLKLWPATLTWQIRNKDSDTATIYSDIGTNPPVTSQGSAAYDGTVSCMEESPPLAGTVYARALATGNSFSAIISYYYDFN